jgi:FAD:protein FMN transferase
MRSTTAEAQGQAGYVASRLRVGLGTFIALETEAVTQQIAEAGIGAAASAISTVERRMHPHRPDGDLGQLAHSGAGAAVRVHPWTWEVLQRCRELHAASAGAFDPCPDASGGLAHLELSEPGVVRVRAPARLDLGGIAKGYAVDRALAAMRVAGCGGGLVNAGGDLAVFGSRSHLVRLGGPGGARFELQNAALATTCTDSPERPAEHRGYYHGADRTRRVSGQVSITAPEAVWADALTKCALLMPPPLLARLLTRLEARVLCSTCALQSS